MTPPVAVFDIHPEMTRPRSRKRTVPATDVVAVRVKLVPFFGVAESEIDSVGTPWVMVTVIACVAVAPV